MINYGISSGTELPTRVFLEGQFFYVLGSPITGKDGLYMSSGGEWLPVASKGFQNSLPRIQNTDLINPVDNQPIGLSLNQYNSLLATITNLQAAILALQTGSPAPIPSPSPSPSPSPAPSPQTFILASNPVTTALTGTNTYNVGPGQTYLTPNTVPWSELQAGDVVNIFYSQTSYRFKLGLRGQGTIQNPIIINGVTDSNGNRPVFDFSSATTAAGSNGTNPVFSSTPMYGETLGGIVIKRGPNDDYFSYNPKFITIQNLELKNAGDGYSYTDLFGNTQNYASSAGIYVLHGEDITIQNCVIHHNGFGIFTQANNDDLFQANKRLILRSNRIYENGVPNSWLEHNCYIQSISPIIEGNYIGQTILNSNGSSYKSRSSGEIFRFNFVEASARALDFVHSEDSTFGIQAQSDFPITHCYGNIILNDLSATNGGSYAPIHFGGDNLGEDDNVAALITPNRPYRNQLYFYNNTVVHKSNSNQSYRVHTFALSLAGTDSVSNPRTRCDAWNNIICGIGSSNFSLLRYVGTLNLYGGNILFGDFADAHDQANAARYDVNRIQSQNIGDPLFVNLSGKDLSLQSGSPAKNISVSVPNTLPASFRTELVVNQEPISGVNGLILRAVNTSSGAKE